MKRLPGWRPSSKSPVRRDSQGGGKGGAFFWILLSTPAAPSLLLVVDPRYFPLPPPSSSRQIGYPDDDLARSCLEASGWDVQSAVNTVLGDGGGAPAPPRGKGGEVLLLAELWRLLSYTGFLGESDGFAFPLS